MSTSSTPGQGIASLQLHELTLTNFRNYSRVAVHLTPSLNILEGPNGAGKTNLLEAVAYLALARSPRTSHDTELVRHGSDAFSLRASHSTDPTTRPRSVAVSYSPQHGKVVHIQGARAERVAALYGELLVTSFTPDDLWLLKGPPTGRRSLLDRLLVQGSPLYAHSAIRYRQALVQRNATLREVRARRAPASLLAAWEPQLVQYGAEILARRHLALSALQPQASSAYALLSEGRESLMLRYLPALADVPPPPHAGRGDGTTPEPDHVLAWGERLRVCLQRTQAADVARATTSCGPHRDDLDVLLNGMPARSHASQGQQRSVVLALKFAERDFLRQATGRLPILLVDDVLSELDAPRRAQLSNLLLRDGQVLLTTAEPSLLAGLASATCYAVRDATVQAVPGGTP